TYARILKNIPEDYKSHTTRILQFLTYSERPLTVDEAVDAIAVEVELRRFDPENRMPDPAEISSYCSSLVTTITREADHEGDDGEKSVVQLQLAHFSVKEYLSSDRLPDDIAKEFKPITARSAVVQVSLAYLLGIDHSLLIAQIRQNFPFASYAAEYWAGQAVMVEKDSEETQQLIAEFFNCGNAYKRCYQLYIRDRSWRSGLERIKRYPSPLYCASFGGLTHSCQMLLENSADVNAEGGRYGNALQAASIEGHEEVIQILLDNSADVNAEGGEYGNALQAASFEGHKEVIQMLLEKDADVNAQGGGYGSAIGAASRNGHL
ncbi:ankyrin repeat-containing domain protein, partial [Diaporthe sp. PMI_573]